MRPNLHMLLSPYKAAPRRPPSASSSRSSTGGGKSQGKRGLRNTASQDHGSIYTSALSHHAPPNIPSSSRRPKLKGPQTLKDLGQQIIRDHQKRLNEAGFTPRFPHSGLSPEKKLLSLTAAGGDMTHLNHLLARYKVLSKELANQKLTAAQPAESSGAMTNAVKWLSNTRSLDASRRKGDSQLGNRTASWPAAASQGCHAVSPLKPGARSFGLSSVISMSTSDALETSDVVSQDQNREGEDSAQPDQRGKRGFGLSALLGGGSMVPNQLGGIGAAQVNERSVT